MLFKNKLWLINRLLLFMILMGVFHTGGLAQTDSVATTTDTESRWFLDIGASTMKFRLGRGWFTRAMFGKQPDRGVYFTWSLSFMLNSLEDRYFEPEPGYIGPDEERPLYQFAASHSGMVLLGVHFNALISPSYKPLTLYFANGFVIGNYGYSESCVNLGPCSAGPTFGIQPEIGALVRLYEDMRLHFAWGTLLVMAIAYDGHKPEHSFSLGIRWYP